MRIAPSCSPSGDRAGPRSSGGSHPTRGRGLPIALFATELFVLRLLSECMLAQNLIRRTLFSDEGRETLAALPAADAFSGRSALVREVCARFDFRDPRGRLQEAGCLSALRELERAGGIVLPCRRQVPVPVSGGRRKASPRRFRRRSVFRIVSTGSTVLWRCGSMRKRIGGGSTR